MYNSQHTGNLKFEKDNFHLGISLQKGVSVVHYGFTQYLLVLRTVPLSFLVTGSQLNKCTEVRFASFLSGGFTTLAVRNPPERKLA